MAEEKYTKEQLEKMSPAQMNNVFLRATKIQGTGVVRDKDGNIKYDNPESAGNYGEQ